MSCDIRLILCYTMCFIYLVCIYVILRWFKLAKIRLFIRSRKQGSYIASVPLKRLDKLSRRGKRIWYFEDGWLILETN